MAVRRYAAVHDVQRSRCLGPRTVSRARRVLSDLKQLDRHRGCRSSSSALSLSAWLTTRLLVGPPSSSAPVVAASPAGSQCGMDAVGIDGSGAAEVLPSTPIKAQPRHRSPSPPRMLSSSVRRSSLAAGAHVCAEFVPATCGELEKKLTDSADSSQGNADEKVILSGLLSEEMLIKMLLAHWAAVAVEAAPQAPTCPQDHPMLYGKADSDYECDECGADIAPRMWDCRFCNWCLCLACGWSRSGRTFRKLPGEDREHVLGKAMEDV